MVTTRSLTEVFILMRNNAVQSKQIFTDTPGRFSYEERASLVNIDSLSGSNGSVAISGQDRIPPSWVDMAEEVQYELNRAKHRLKELKSLQDRHVLRPSFNESDIPSEEELAIRNGTDQITAMLSHCQRLIQHLQVSAGNSGGKLGSNVIRTVIFAVQQVAVEFRSVQTAYMKRLQTRQDDYQQFFEPIIPTAGGVGDLVNVPLFTGALDLDIPSSTVIDEEVDYSKGPPTMAQLQAMEDSHQVVEQREREILAITKSIVELNSLFKELATIIVEQGSIVDRIDYNIEQGAVKVKSALGQVKKAEQYQRKNRKMMIIVVLCIIITFLLVILIIRKL